MSDLQQYKGPWMHRFLIWIFAIALALLVFWLLGFIVGDIGEMRGPSRADVEKQFVDAQLVEQEKGVAKQIKGLDRDLAAQKARRTTLRESTRTSRETMNQLLEFQRLNIQKDVKPSAEEQQALAESQTLFLSNQKREQELNEDISRLEEEKRSLDGQRRDVATRLAEQRKPAYEELRRLTEKHRIKIGFLKLLVLIPLLLVALFFFLKRRASVYTPLIHACGIALVVRVGMVMHEYFPKRYFKYILVVALIAVVLRILVSLLRMIASPQKDWLLKQYREAYEKFFCPVCSYPIRRGPLKYVFWTPRTIKKLFLREPPESPQRDEPYTCPACGSKVYEECESCQAIRASYLPFCDACGAERDLAD